MNMNKIKKAISKIPYECLVMCITGWMTIEYTTGLLGIIEWLKEIINE